MAGTGDLAVAPAPAGSPLGRSPERPFLAHGPGLTLFIVAHVPVGLLMREFAPLATLHALLAFGIGFWWAALDHRMERIAFVGAYIAGAEVLWRMTDASVFWEFGKYATAALFLLAIWRLGRPTGPPLAFLYFGLLLPAVLMTVFTLEPAAVRRGLSFNLSGPFAILICAWFLSYLRFSANQCCRVLLVMIAPIAGIAALTLTGTLTAADIRFTGESNFATSGGFGPNQVSAVLGLGALLALLLALQEGVGWRDRALMAGAVVGLAALSAMTFSRGGLYNAGAAAFLGLIFLARNPKARRTLALIGALLFAVIPFVLWPRLDAFTDGHLSARFRSTDLTGREHLIMADLQAWREHPLFGTGPGAATTYRLKATGVSEAHTEFSRLLSEHGLCGLAALLVLLLAATRNVMRARTPMTRALAASLVGWSFLFMTNAALRLVAPAFLFGLTFATIVPDVVRRTRSGTRQTRETQIKTDSTTERTGCTISRPVKP